MHFLSVHSAIAHSKFEGRQGNGVENYCLADDKVGVIYYCILYPQHHPLLCQIIGFLLRLSILVCLLSLCYLIKDVSFLIGFCALKIISLIKHLRLCIMGVHCAYLFSHLPTPIRANLSSLNAANFEGD